MRHEPTLEEELFFMEQEEGEQDSPNKDCLDLALEEEARTLEKEWWDWRFPEEEW